jgi:hypothetical protein
MSPAGPSQMYSARLDPRSLTDGRPRTQGMTPSGAQERQHGDDPAVVAGVRGQVELHEVFRTWASTVLTGG